MTTERAYDVYVKRGIAVVVAVFALMWALPMTAQINGVPASVTSIGFGGNFSRPPGVAASVTSIGPAGLVPNRNIVVPNNFVVPGCCANQFFPNNVRPPAFSHHHHHNNSVGLGFVAVPYAVPVPVPYAVDDEADDAEAEQYSSAPVTAERRAPAPVAQQRYEPPAQDQQIADSAAPAPEPEQSVPDQPSTVLVFKDGHSIEVENYAIVGDSLYDLTPGHRRKLALSDLDVNATVKENNDRGLDFEMPDGAE